MGLPIGVAFFVPIWQTVKKQRVTTKHRVCYSIYSEANEANEAKPSKAKQTEANEANAFFAKHCLTLGSYKFNSIWKIKKAS